MDSENEFHFGPAAPTINEMRGIRYTDLGGDGSGAAGDQPPAVEGEQEPVEYAPTGDEPWAKYMENVPDILKPELDRGFRELSASADQRIATLTPYEPLVTAGIKPEEAQIAVEFAAMLYGQADPNDPVAQTLSKQQRLNFYNQYTAVLQEQGVLTKAEKQQADADEAARVAAEREFETPEQKELRELREQYAQLAAGQGHVAEVLAGAQQQAQYQQLTQSYQKDWEAAIAANGQVSKREFELISTFAQADPDDSPGVIQRAYQKLLTTVGRLPDPETPTPTPTTPRPPVIQPGGAQQITAPTTPSLRLDSPEGRHNRKQAAMEALALLEQEGAPSV